MPTRQGDLALLNHPVAQRLLHGKIPARVAYTWLDGTPRVTPIHFHWDGRDLVLSTFPRSPKVRALQQDPRVAVTIDSEEPPEKILQIRGMATLETYMEIQPETVACATRVKGEEGGQAWVAQLAMLTAAGGVTLIRIRPEWVAVIDFVERFPNSSEEAMAQLAVLR